MDQRDVSNISMHNRCALVGSARSCPKRSFECLSRDDLGVCTTANQVCYSYFYMFVWFSVANEYWEAFDFSYPFTVWTHIYYINFVLFPNIKWVLYASSAFVFCISWSSFFRAKNTSSSFSTLSIYEVIRLLHKFGKRNQKEPSCGLVNASPRKALSLIP
jgi:hypothetical protein